MRHTHHDKVTVRFNHLLCKKFVVPSFFFQPPCYFQEISGPLQGVPIQHLTVHFHLFVLGILSIASQYDR